MNIVQRFITNQANYTAGRHWGDGNAINRIVVHTYGGKGTSLFNWFQTNTARVSAHYAVMKDGLIEQYVRDGDTASANGHGWYNAHAISIEFQDDGNPSDAARTAALYEAGSQLIFDICVKYGIHTDRAHIRTHREVLQEIGKYKECPGGLDVDKLVNRAKEYMNEYQNLKQIVGTLDNQLKEATSRSIKLAEQFAAETAKVEGLMKQVNDSLAANQVLMNQIDELNKQIETLQAGSGQGEPEVPVVIEHPPLINLLIKLYERLVRTSK